VKISLSRETVVVSKFEVDLNEANVKELVSKLAFEKQIEIDACETVSEFLDEVTKEGYEAALFDVMKDYMANEMVDEYRDGEEYFLKF
jgi:uncharacterized membrane-anchored protein YjiN (DUF445 family)